MQRRDIILERKFFKDKENKEIAAKEKILTILEEYLKFYNKKRSRPNFKDVYLSAQSFPIKMLTNTYPELKFLNLREIVNKETLEEIDSYIFEALNEEEKRNIIRLILREIRTHINTFYRILFRDYREISKLFSFYQLNKYERAEVLLELGEEIKQRYKEILNLFISINQKYGVILNQDNIYKLIGYIKLLPFLTDRERIERIIEYTNFPLEIVIEIAKYTHSKEEELEKIVTSYKELKEKFPDIEKTFPKILPGIVVNAHYEKNYKSKILISNND